MRVCSSAIMITMKPPVEIAMPCATVGWPLAEAAAACSRSICHLQSWATGRFYMFYTSLN